VRAYGEMVDILWRDGNTRAAVHLEQLWNEASERHAFVLFCAYSMGHFYRASDAVSCLEVCRAHSHVLPLRSVSALEAPQSPSAQRRVEALESEVQQRKQLEAALREALAERRHAEERLRVALLGEKEARARLEAEGAFMEVLLGRLGHDLQGPLHTVLSSVRLLETPAEPDADRAGHLAHLEASGLRMQRMVEQILDVARARRASGGLPVAPVVQDVSLLVATIVEAARAANPRRVVELDATSCACAVDGAAVARVLSNLIDNALTHGDRDQPVVVRVAPRAHAVTISVHNHGQPIDPVVLPKLFDPFRPGPRPKGPSSGLGLGLYIADCIARAHGGHIDVDSTAAEGTRFEVVLPLGG
jgi:signal transduction histidine kinase